MGLDIRGYYGVKLVGIREATALLFLYGRLHFYRPDGSRALANAGAPSVLVAYGPEDAARLASSGLPGKFIRLKEG